MGYPDGMGTKRTNPRKDFTQVALSVVQQATGEVAAPAPSKKQESGRKGGLVGGVARATNMTPEQRSEIARLAAQARWKKAP
jgi:general stress protein YciG